MGGPSAVQGAGARGVQKASRSRPRGQLSPVRPAGKVVYLVGLPNERLSPQPGPAHRPYPAVERTCGPMRELRGRPRTAQTGAAIGSRAGRCRAERLDRFSAAECEKINFLRAAPPLQITPCSPKTGLAA